MPITFNKPQPVEIKIKSDFDKSSDVIVGTFVNNITSSNQLTDTLALESTLNRKFDFVQFFAIPSTIDYANIKPLRDAGYSVLITLEPSASYQTLRGPGNLAQILAGDFDAQILALITQINADNRPNGDKTELLIEFMHEFNQNFYSWGLMTSPNDPSDFVPAFQKLSSLFKTNLLPTVRYKIVQRFNRDSGTINNEKIKITDYYAGDNFVDLIGFTNYVRTGANYQQQHAFETWFDNTYNEISAICDKPMIISETGVSGSGSLFPSISSGGSGLPSNFSISLSAPPVGGRQAVFTSTVSGGVLTRLTYSDPGEGYVTAPTVTFNNLGAGVAPAVTFSPVYVPKVRELENIGQIIKTRYPKIRAVSFFNPYPWYPSKATEKQAMVKTIDTLRSTRPQVIRQKEARVNEALDYTQTSNWTVSGTNPGVIATSTSVIPDITTAPISLSWTHVGNQTTSKNNRLLQTLSSSNIKSFQDVVISFFAIATVDGMQIQGVEEKTGTANTFDQYISQPYSISTNWKYYEIPVNSYFFNNPISIGLQEYASPVQGQGSVAGTIYIANYKVERGSLGTPFIAPTSSVLTTGTNAFTGTNTFATTSIRSSFNLGSGNSPTSPVNGDIWNDVGDKSIVTQVAGQRQLLATALRDQTSVTRATVANTVTETALTSWATAAAFFTNGKHLWLVNTGRYSTTGTPTLKFDMYFGSQLFATTGAITMASSVTDLMFKMEQIFQLNGTPSSSSAMSCGGTIKIWTNTTTGVLEYPFFSNGSFNIDTTIANSIQLRVTWGTAAAGNSINSRVSTQLSI